MTHGEIYSSNIISHFIYEAELLIKKSKDVLVILFVF